MNEAIALLGTRIGRRIQFAPSGCWLWTGTKTGKGYASARSFLGKAGLHRVAYILLRGEIPSGLQLDHLCRCRHCVNPAHLEPVTPQINVLRGEGFAAKNVLKTHCPKGHPYDAANRTGRYCKRCRNERRRGK